jgi:hypothetical protein
MVVVHLIKKKKNLFVKDKLFILPEFGMSKCSVSDDLALSIAVNPSIAYLSSPKYFNLN